MRQGFFICVFLIFLILQKIFLTYINVIYGTKGGAYLQRKLAILFNVNPPYKAISLNLVLPSAWGVLE